SNGLKEAYFQKYEACSPSYGSEIVNACESYTWIDGITYTSSNSSATHIIQNASGCDSIVSLDLTIENLTELATSTVGATITAENNLATYQWLDCNNGFTVISGETGQSYTPGANGNYAVELDQNGCIDTTACVSILTVGLENHWINQLQIHPNPSSGIFNMELTEAAVITVLDARGRTVVETNGKGRFTLDLSGFSTGTYTLQLRTDSGVGTKRLVRQ
ncbi:MAG: T9SS type A sorting domain-containing protein, partial [Flavobacteriales bacterium]|nr:T9SS type A sorting domain-containing protein [Flavobacteriales bacterium]